MNEIKEPNKPKEVPPRPTEPEIKPYPSQDPNPEPRIPNHPKPEEPKPPKTPRRL